MDTMLGVTIVFTIPAVLGIVDKNNIEHVATGIMAGVMTVPIGAFAGGLVAGYPVKMICSNPGYQARRRTGHRNQRLASGCSRLC